MKGIVMCNACFNIIWQEEAIFKMNSQQRENEKYNLKNLDFLKTVGTG